MNFYFLYILNCVRDNMSILFFKKTENIVLIDIIIQYSLISIRYKCIFISQKIYKDMTKKGY